MYHPVKTDEIFHCKAQLDFMILGSISFDSTHLNLEFGSSGIPHSSENHPTYLRWILLAKVTSLVGKGYPSSDWLSQFHPIPRALIFQLSGAYLFFFLGVLGPRFLCRLVSQCSGPTFQCCSGASKWLGCFRDVLILLCSAQQWLFIALGTPMKCMYIYIYIPRDSCIQNFGRIPNLQKNQAQVHKNGAM